LRAAVLRTDLTACPGLGVLRRRDLAVWIREVADKWDDPDSQQRWHRGSHGHLRGAIADALLLFLVLKLCIAGTANF
jgi:hypothetical protein